MKNTLLFLAIILSACKTTPDAVPPHDGGFDTVDLTPAPSSAAAQPAPSAADESGRIDDLVNSPQIMEEHPPYMRYENRERSFSALVHSSWHITNSRLDSADQITRFTNGSAKISVRSFCPAEGSLTHYYQRCRESIRQQDPSSHIFIDNRDIAFTRGTSGKLIVAQYRPASGSSRNIIRALIVVQNNNAYIITCEAPVSSFYRSERHFNTFMRSFRAQ